MNIRELIQQLTDAADELIEGLDAKVLVHLCRGHDGFSILTKAVGVSSDDTAVLIQGHPHLDDSSTARRPDTMGIDDELAKSVADPDSRPEPVPTFVLVQFAEDKAYQMPLRDTGKILAPGDIDALRVGCLCDPSRNDAARDYKPDATDGVAMIVNQDCPVHRIVPFGGTLLG